MERFSFVSQMGSDLVSDSFSGLNLASDRFGFGFCKKFEFQTTVKTFVYFWARRHHRSKCKIEIMSDYYKK